MRADPMRSRAPTDRRRRPRNPICIALCLASTGLAQQEPLAPIAGVVRDAGEPVRGGTALVRWRTGRGLPGTLGRALTDQGVDERRVPIGADGRFRIEHAPHDVVEIMALAAVGERPRRSAPRFPVVPGDYVTLDLDEPTLVGGIVDIGGEPATGIAVSLVPERSSLPRIAAYRIPEWRSTTTADGDGRWHLPLPPGYLRSPRWEPFLIAHFATPDHWPARDVLLRPTEGCAHLRTSLVDVRRLPISIVGQDGEPIVGAAVHLEGMPHWTVECDATGSASLPIRGGCTLVVRAPGHGPVAVPPPSSAEILAQTPFRVVPHAAPELALTLVDAKGAPLVNHRVLFAVPLGRAQAAETLASTDADGRVTFSGAAPDQTVLAFVERHGIWQCAHATVPNGGSGTPIPIGAPRSLSGTVVDRRRQPIAGARVVLVPEGWPADQPFVAFADRGGRFSFPAVPPGRLTLAAEGAHRGVTRWVQVDAGGDGPVALAVEQEGTCHGVVVDPQGDRVANAWVMLSREGGGPLLPGDGVAMSTLCALSEADGTFAIEGLPAGVWTVRAQYVRQGHLHVGTGSGDTSGTEARIECRDYGG